MGLITLLFEILFALSIGLGIYVASVMILLPGKPAADESHDVTTQDGWRIRLYRYLPKGEAASKEPVLVVHGANTNQWNMAAPSDESLVGLLARNGFDTWCIELRGCQSSQAPSGTTRYAAKFDDYLLYDLPAAIAYIGEHAEHDKIHWIGHSMGGLLLYAYVAANGRGPIATGVTIGAPPGFDGDPEWDKYRRLTRTARKFPRLFEWLWRTAAPLYPVFKLNFAFAPVNWLNMHKNADPKVFYNAAEMLPPEVADTFLDWATAARPMTMLAGKVQLEDCYSELDVPMLVMFGAADPLTPKPRMSRMFDALPNQDKQLLMLAKAAQHANDYNHIDLVWGREARRDVFRPITQWLAAHPFDGNPQVEFSADVR